MGENLHYDSSLLQGPHDSFGGALIEPSISSEDACGEDCHSEHVSTHLRVKTEAPCLVESSRGLYCRLFEG